MIDWNDIRKQFPILDHYTYLNTARFCAMPTRVIDKQTHYLAHLGMHGSWYFDKWMEDYEATRKLAANLMGAPPSSVFFLPNVSTGINLSVQYVKKEKVILLKGDFPSVVLPWRSHDCDIVWLDRKNPAFSEDLTTELKKGNRAFCVSWIQAEDGFEIDLERINPLIKKYDNTLILDGTQGLSAIPFEVDPEMSMAFFSSSFKWMLAGYGVAVGYLSNDLLPTFKAFTGWNSIDHEMARSKPGAASLEVGNAMFLNVLALKEGLSIIRDIGPEAIFKRNQQLTVVLAGLLKKASIPFDIGSKRSSIVRIRTANYDHLVKSRIQCTDQGDLIRTSHHFYNNEEDLQNLVDHLKHV